MKPVVRIAGYALNTIGPVADLEWSSRWTYPSTEDGSGISGPAEASFKLLIPTLDAEWFGPGARMQVTQGGRTLWGGVLGEPERTEAGMECHGFGYGSLGANFDAFAGIPVEPTFVPDTAVDAAILSGLPWKRVGTIGSTALGGTDESSVSIETIVSRGAKAAGKRPHVDSFGNLTLQSDRPVPVWRLGGISNYLGTTDENFYTRMRGVYVKTLDINGNPVRPLSSVSVEDVAAATKFGGHHREIPVDLSPLGVITEATALANITARFGLVGGRMGWTRGLAIGAHQLRRITGEPALPSSIREGDVITIPGLRDSRSRVANLVAAQITVGSVRYVADDGVAFVEPLGYVPRDFQSAIAAAQAPRGSEAA